MFMLNDKCRLALLGQAVGDAFGAPFEYNDDAAKLAQQSMTEKRYLNSAVDCGSNSPRLSGLYTDDTQQALVLVYCRLNTQNKEEAARLFLNTCAQMSKVEIPGASFGVHRGTGGNFREAISTRTPVPTAGLGGAMRVGPVATLFDDPQEMVDWIGAVTRVTTHHALGVEVALKFAAIAWALSHDLNREELRNVVWPNNIPTVMNIVTNSLRVVKKSGAKGLLSYGVSSGLANRRLYSVADGFGLTGFAWAVHCMLTATSFEEALLMATSQGGDADTLGAMVGCLAALRLGEESIPFWMTEQLVGEKHIRNPENWSPIVDEQELTELEKSGTGMDLFDYWVNQDEHS